MTRGKADADYEGVRVTMQLDVGFGDVIMPEAQAIVYPALLTAVARGPFARAY